MPKYIVTHGSLKSAAGVAKIGDTVEMSEEERKHLDPHGNKFATPEVAAELAKADAATKRAAELSLAPSEPSKSAKK